MARRRSARHAIEALRHLVYGSIGVRLAREDDRCAPVDEHPTSKLAAQRFLVAMEGLDAYVLRLPFVYGDGDAHIAEAVPLMRSFPPTQRFSLGYHIDVAQAGARLLDAASPAHRI